MADKEPCDPLTLLKLWKERAQLSSKVHYQIASRRMGWNTLLSIGVVVASTVVGSALFASLNDESDGGPTVWLAMVSIAAGVLAGLQRILSLAELGEKHRQAGAQWDRIFNRLCIRMTHVIADEPKHGELEKLAEEMSQLVFSSPYIPQRAFVRVGLHVTYDALSKCEEPVSTLEDRSDKAPRRWWPRRRRTG